MWVRFMDMHSGGDLKEPPYEKIYIEAASEHDACVIFRNRFGHSPFLIGCDCCGENYSIGSDDTLEAATEYSRTTSLYGKEPKEFESLDSYLKRKSVLVIHESEILPEERVGKTGRGHYEWVEED